MNSKERIAYLRGLLDFLPKEEKETKIYSAIADALESLAFELGEQTKLTELQRVDYDSLAEEMDELHEAMYDLEESIGVMESDSDSFSADAMEELTGVTESYISMTCPLCSYSFYYKHEEGRENDRFICPNCGEEVSRSL